MSFSLLLHPWIPVCRESGRAAWLRPCDITSEIDADPIVALDWPRPDFRLAGLEFLIGLLATACPPTFEDGIDEAGDWHAWWRAPPTPEQLAAAFAPFERAFVLDGDGPRFMQDFEAFGGEANRAETLLIDAPGGQTLKKNTDHFVKRDRVGTMGRAAAAIALFTLQSFAPAGGAGNRVGLRGGGPLTTLAVPPWPPGRQLPLWHMLWANVPVGEAPETGEVARVFPWLGPSRTSEGGRPTTPGDVHPLQAYWGMARRIRLDFAANDASAPCDLDGRVDEVVVRGWRQRPYGANYATWPHPLSPYYRQKPNDLEWLPVHAQPGGVGYRHWVGMLFADPAALRRPAACIAAFTRNRLSQISGTASALHWRMLAAGYDMDNMKARGFVESEMPVTEPGDRAHLPGFAHAVCDLVGGATEVAGLLGRSVRRALFSDGAKVALDAGLLASLRERFWAATEPAFLRHIQSAAASEAEPVDLRERWRRDLAAAARALFAEAAPIDATGADRRPDRIAAAARGLNLALNGYGKDGDALFRTLRLPPRETKLPKPKKGAPA